MYTVSIEEECKCFNKSEYSKSKTFDRQKDAYANLLTELMNEDFCSQHTFSAQRVEGSNFLITMKRNMNAIAGYNPHITCDSTDNWSLEAGTDLAK